MVNRGGGTIRAWAILLTFGSLVGACGGEASSENGAANEAQADEAEANDESSVGSSTLPEVKALAVSDTWVFTVPPADGYNQALFVGTANIADGCLRIGEAIVIWREENLPEAEAAVAAVLAGETMVLRLGGSGNQVQDSEAGEPGESLPVPVGEYCTANSFWWASPEVSVDSVPESETPGSTE